MLSKRIPNPFQLVHLTKLLVGGAGGLLVCDGVGVGKTISAGYIISYALSVLKRSALVVCPTTLVQKWQLELRGKFGLSTASVRSPEALESVTEDVEGRARARSPIALIVPYSLLSRVTVDEPPPVALLVVDEIHTIRNPRTRAYAGVRRLATKASNRVGLSATPIHNQLGDLSSELSVLFPNFTKAALEAVVAEAWTKDQAEVLRPWLTRFDRGRLGVNPTHRAVETEFVRCSAEYVQIVEETLDRRSHQRGPVTGHSAFEETVLMRLAASSPAAFFFSVSRPPSLGVTDSKMNALLALLATEPHTRFVVFCDFIETAEEIGRRVEGRPALVVTGKTDIDSRLDLLRQFDETPDAVLVMTPVGGEGLDLQSASHVVNFDLHWNPMVLEQRIGRVDRIGQQSGVVHVTNFVVEGSIDERIVRVLRRKLALLESSPVSPPPIVGGTTVGPSGAFRALPPPGETVLKAELAAADTLIEGQTLWRQLPEGDYDLAASIPTSACNIESWDLDPDSWIDGPPWMREGESTRGWSALLSQRAHALSGLAHAYDQP